MDKLDALGKSYSHKGMGKKRIKKKFYLFKSKLDEEQTKIETTSISSSVENITDIEDLLDQVYESGDKLKEKTTFESISNYKEAIKKFIAYITSNMLDVEEKTSGINILKRKRFTIIKIIDRKLESLIKDVLNQQNEQINILARIDEINGLLVDLVS